MVAAALLSTESPAAEPLLIAPPGVMIGPHAPQAVDSFAPKPTSSGLAPSMSAAMQPCCPNGIRYWIVSSRTAPQDIRRVRCGHLSVYERRCDGTLRPSGLASLVGQLQPGAPVLLSLHGSWVSWEDNLVQSDGTWEWIRRACPNRPLNVIFFTWPSERTRCLLAPCELRRQGFEAEVNAFYVASLLSFLPDCHPYCLLGHSYGARMTMAALHLAGGGALQGICFGGNLGAKRIRAILAAAALDHNWLNDGGRYDRALCRAECVLNLQNRHDLALKFYPLLRPLQSRRAIGASGVTYFDRYRQTCTCRIKDCDVTRVVGKGHFWPNYYEVPALAGMVAPWVYYPELSVGLPHTGYSNETPLLMPTPEAGRSAERSPDVMRVSARSGRHEHDSSTASRYAETSPRSPENSSFGATKAYAANTSQSGPRLLP